MDFRTLKAIVYCEAVKNFSISTKISSFEMTTPLLFFFVLPCLSFLLLVSLKGNNDTFCICCCFFSFTSEDAHSKRKSMSRVCCTDSNEVVDKSSRSCRLRCCCTDAYKLYRVSIEKSQKVMKRRIV